MSETRQERRKREKRQARERRVRRAANMRSKGGSPVGRSRMGRRPAYWRGAW